MLIDLPLPAVVAAAENEIMIHTLEVFHPETNARIIAAATREFITLPSDTLSNYPFHGTLIKALSFQRSVADGGTAFNGMASGYGELELENSDGAYDGLASLAGARFLCKAGWLGASFDTYLMLLDGIVSNSYVEQGQIRIEIEDRASLLDVPVQSTLYGGAGGADGDASIAQKRKPLALGFPKNTSPSFNDPVNDVYDISGGLPIYAVSEVRDNGVVLDLQSPGPTDFANYAALIAGTVSASKYITCLAEGKIRLGASAGGTIACDVTGLTGDVNSTGETIIRTAGQQARYLLERAGIQVDIGSFLNLDVLSDASVDYYLDSNSNKTVRDAVNEILGGIDAWGGLRRDGVFDVGRIDTPADASISAVYREIDIFEIDRIALPKNIDPPPWRLRIPYYRNWTIQTNVLAATIPATAAFVATPYKLAEASEASVLAANPKAHDPEPRQCFYSDEFGSAAEANRLFGLLSGTAREMYRVVVSTRAFTHNIGNVIQIFHSRFELSSGATAVIVGVRDDATDEAVELTVLV